MHWLAALVTALIYLYNVPLKAAVVLNERGATLSLRPFSVAAAVKAARRKISRREEREKPPQKKPSGNPFSFYISALRHILPHVFLDHFHLYARVGLDDAALTAVVCGFIASAGHMAACRARNAGKVSVTPDFNSPCLAGELCAVLSISAGRALFASACGVTREKIAAPLLGFFQSRKNIASMPIFRGIYRPFAGNNITDGG